MSLPLILHPDVYAEIRSHRDWYRDISVDLGQRFGDSLIATFERLQQYPEMYAFVDDGIRCARLAWFPHQVFYHPAKDRTYVLGLYHCHVEPQSSLRKVASRKPIAA